MKQSIVWTKEDSIMSCTEKVGHYRGVRVEKTTHFYYFNWSEHVNWAAPHSKLSLNYRSAISIKSAIDSMLAKEAQDLTIIVRRFDPTEQKALWAARDYRSPIGAFNCHSEAV